VVHLNHGNVLEMFSSIQGEGLLVGCRQVFMRLGGCNLACHYCDTQYSRKPQMTCRIETYPGSRSFQEVQNPLSVDLASEYLQTLCSVRPHSISFTGGEPLFQGAFLLALLQNLKAFPVRKYLETNGTLCSELLKIIDLIDIIGMDIKLPSVTGSQHWAEHHLFLKAARGKNIFVKIVVGAQTPQHELHRAVEMIAEVDRVIPLILQPMTANEEISAPEPALVLAMQEDALNYLDDVRVIPQTHKLLGQL